MSKARAFIFVEGSKSIGGLNVDDPSLFLRFAPRFPDFLKGSHKLFSREGVRRRESGMIVVFVAEDLVDTSHADVRRE